MGFLHILWRGDTRRREEWRRTTAIRAKAVSTREAQTIDRLPLGVGRAGYGLFQSDFVVIECARPIVDPDMVMMVDIEPADLPEYPVVGQRLWPSGIDDEIRRRTGFRFVVDARLLEQQIQRSALEWAPVVGS